MPRMSLTHYYAPPYQKLSSGGSESSLRQDSLETKEATVPSAEDPNRLDPLEMLMAGKLRIIETAIEQITNEIEDRENLQKVLLDTIDDQICDQKEALNQVAPHGSSPFTVGDSKRRASIEKELAALEAEKRKETCSAWKDIANLKKEMRDLLREHNEEKRRQQVIGK